MAWRASLLAVPAGQLSDWLGRRPTLAIGGLVSAFGNLCCAWASAYPELVVARFVAGAGAGLILTTGQVVLADISTPERRGRSIAIYQGTFLFAVGIGPFRADCSPSISDWPPRSSPMVLPVCSRPSSPGLPSARRATCGAPPPGARDPVRPPLAQQLRLLTGKVGFCLGEPDLPDERGGAHRWAVCHRADAGHGPARTVGGRHRLCPHARQHLRSFCRLPGRLARPIGSAARSSSCRQR